LSNLAVFRAFCVRHKKGGEIAATGQLRHPKHPSYIKKQPESEHQREINLPHHLGGSLSFVALNSDRRFQAVGVANIRRSFH